MGTRCRIFGTGGGGTKGLHDDQSQACPCYFADTKKKYEIARSTLLPKDKQKRGAPDDSRSIYRTSKSAPDSKG